MFLRDSNASGAGVRVSGVALQSHRSTGQVAGVNTAAGDESYLSGRRLRYS